MMLVWAGLIALAVWGIARLFPDRTAPTPTRTLVPPQPGRGEDDAPSPLVESGRR
jgi:hypothetical protein